MPAGEVTDREIAMVIGEAERTVRKAHRLDRSERAMLAGLVGFTGAVYGTVVWELGRLAGLWP